MVNVLWHIVESQSNSGYPWRLHAVLEFSEGLRVFGGEKREEGAIKTEVEKNKGRKQERQSEKGETKDTRRIPWALLCNCFWLFKIWQFAVIFPTDSSLSVSLCVLIYRLSLYSQLTRWNTEFEGKKNAKNTLVLPWCNGLNERKKWNSKIFLSTPTCWGDPSPQTGIKGNMGAGRC